MQPVVRTTYRSPLDTFDEQVVRLAFRVVEPSLPVSQFRLDSRVSADQPPLVPRCV